MDQKFALIRNVEMSRLNEYLHNKIEEDFQKESNQHTITLNIEADTMHHCKPSCIFVLVMLPSKYATQRGEVSLSVTYDDLHIQPETSHNL